MGVGCPDIILDKQLPVVLRRCRFKSRVVELERSGMVQPLHERRYKSS